MSEEELELVIGLEEEYSPYQIPYSRTATIFAAVCASIFTVIGILGNLLTIVGLLKCQKLRSHATTMFVISLAISDLLFAAVNLPLTASRYVHQKWIHGEVLCRLFPFFFYGNVAASLMNMVAITINRYVLISCHTTYGRIYSKCNIIIMIFVVWMFSFGMLVPPLAEVWGSLGLNEETFSCTILKRNGSSPKKFLMLFAFLMPAIVIMCSYTAIFLKVRQSRRNVQSHMNEVSSSGPISKGNVPTQAQTAQRREDIRLTKMMLTIFLCFLVCFLPLMLVNVMDDDVDYPNLHILASILAWASAVINPFIYAFKNRQYQQAFAKVLCIKSLSGGSSGVRNTQRMLNSEPKLSGGSKSSRDPPTSSSSSSSTAQILRVPISADSHTV